MTAIHRTTSTSCLLPGLVLLLAVLLEGPAGLLAQPYAPPPEPPPDASTASPADPSGARGDGVPQEDPQSNGEPQEIALEPPADPDLAGMEPAVQERLRDEREALMVLLEREEIDIPLLAEAMGEIGLVYQAHGLADAAALSYRNALRLAPDDFRWSHALAVLHYEENDLETAHRLFEATLQRQQRNLGAWLYLTEIYLTENRVDDAAKTVANAAALSSNSPAVLDLQGRVAMARDEPEKAVEAFEFALAQVPEANRLHYQLAMAYRALGEMEKAKDHLARAGQVGVQIPDRMRREVEERKSGERLLLLEGRRAFNAGAYAEAAEAFRRALEARPESLTARVNLASALALAGEPEKGIVELEAVLAQDPDRREARYNLGSLLLRAGRPGDALPHLQKVVEADPDDMEARRELGVAYRDLGQAREALETLHQVTEATNDQRAVIALGETLVRLGRYAQAKDFLMERYLMNPRPGPVAGGLARLLASVPVPSLRDGRKAVVLAQKQMESASNVANAETLALALAEAGRCDEAAEIQRQLLGAEGVPAERISELAEALARYAKGAPCRPPFPTASADEAADEADDEADDESPENETPETP